MRASLPRREIARQQLQIAHDEIASRTRPPHGLRRESAPKLEPGKARTSISAARDGILRKPYGHPGDISGQTPVPARRVRCPEAPFVGAMAATSCRKPSRRPRPAAAKARCTLASLFSLCKAGSPESPFRKPRGRLARNAQRIGGGGLVKILDIFPCKEEFPPRGEPMTSRPQERPLLRVPLAQAVQINKVTHFLYFSFSFFDIPGHRPRSPDRRTGSAHRQHPASSSGRKAAARRRPAQGAIAGNHGHPRHSITLGSIEKMRRSPNSRQCFLKHVLRQLAIPHQAHAYGEEDRCGFVVKGPESLAIARGDRIKQAT